MDHNISIRYAGADDVPALLSFILTHGPNQWNFLPEDGVREHLNGIVSGKVGAVMAELDGALAGFVSFMREKSMKRYQSADARSPGYVCEAVVRRDLAGKGIGSTLLREAVRQLAQQGCAEIYIERHEENLASGGMMRKAGFVEIDTFDDPERRSSGSRRTTVCRLVVS
jgi:ribosomal protein S18 acetylase RimI-like enzyme